MNPAQTATVCVALTVVLDEGYPGDLTDLQADVTRLLDDRPLTTLDGREVGRMAVANIASSSLDPALVD